MYSNLLSDNKYLDQALLIMEALKANGYESWIVGGCIRDAILGRNSNDIDIATSASWEEVEATCIENGLKVRRTGTAHGTVTVLVQIKGFCEPTDLDCEDEDVEYAAFEITTYRIDAPTSSDSRHPDFVEFTDSIVEDLARRDFTMNAMAWNPEHGLLDPFGGLDDIENATIRVVGDPAKRFKEDALRILRGCRFASQLRFEIEAETLQSMYTCKSLLLSISAERISSELTLLLMGEYVHDALMDYCDIISICVPEIVAMKGFEQRTKYHIYDVLEHTAWVVQKSKNTKLIRWAAFCHDMGKPSCSFFDADGVQHFYGHAFASERIAKGLFKRLSFNNSFVEKVLGLVKNHNYVIEPNTKSIKRSLMRLNGDVDLLNDMFELKTADMLSHAPEYVHQAAMIDEARSVLDEVLKANEAFSLKHLAVNGNDLINAGIEMGPEVGRILNLLLEKVIDGELPNEHDVLLEFAKENQA